jgi:circadian clock protein KaiC
MTDRGIDLVDVYLGSDHVLLGTARVALEEHEKTAAQLRKKSHERRLRDLANRQRAIDAQIEALQATAAADLEEVDFLNDQENLEWESAVKSSQRMSSLRGGSTKINRKK